MKLSTSTLFICKFLALGINAKYEISGITIRNLTTTVREVQVTAPPSSVQWSFIIQKKNTQKCNIFGPLCQTGSITVGVGSINATATTTLPCSDYLTLQSIYLNKYNHYPCQVNFVNDRDWMREFGRGSECATYADYKSRHAPFTFSNCGEKNKAATLGCEGGLVPPGVEGHYMMFYRYYCCGGCIVDIPEFRLLYFLDKDAETTCVTNRTIGSNSTTKFSAIASNRKRAHSLVTAVSGTYTFTSPSIYLEVIGKATLKDFCGPLGSVYTNPMITLPLEAVSTFVPESYFFKEGQKWFDPGVLGMKGTTKPLNLADLACPTFGVGKSTDPDGTVQTTYGAPYLPIIIPPKQLTTLDPVWQKSCTLIYSAGEFLKSFAIVDPPRILQPAAAMGPASPAQIPAIETPVLQPLRTKPNASPVSNPGKILPAATLAPDNNGVSNPKDSNPASNVPNPDFHHLDNRPSADLTDPSKFNPLLKPHNPYETLTNTKVFHTQKQKLAEPLASNSQAVKTSDADSAHPNDPNYVPVQQSSGPSLGELIIGVLYGAKLGSAVDGIANSGRAESDDGGRASQKNHGDSAPQKPPPQSPKTFLTAGQAFEPVQSPGIFVAAGLLFTPLLSSQGVAIYGKTIVPGGSVVTFAEAPVSLDLSGGLQVGSSLFIVPTPAVPEVRGGAAFSAAGFAFTSLPILSEGSAINMQTLVPGGRGASKTVSKTNINFNPPGSLHLGSLPTPLPTSVPSNSDGWLIIANGLTFTFLSYGKKLVIDSQTLVPGGFSATVSGTRIFLDGMRGLHVGSSPLIYLPTPAPGSVGVAVFTAGGREFTLLSSTNGVVVINGQTLTAGGLPIAISGSFISLDPTDGIHVGSSLIILPTQVPSFENSVFIASGFKFTSLPSLRVAIDGQTLSPGGSPVTVLGTRVSLDPTGGLRVGSWLIAHSTPTLYSEELEIYSNGGGLRPLTRLPHLEIVTSSTTFFRDRATATFMIISGTPMSSNSIEYLSQAGTSIVFNSSTTASNSSLVGVFFSGQASRVKGSPYHRLVGVVSGMYFLLYWM